MTKRNRAAALPAQNRLEKTLQAQASRESPVHLPKPVDEKAMRNFLKKGRDWHKKPNLPKHLRVQHAKTP